MKTYVRGMSWFFFVLGHLIAVIGFLKMTDNVLAGASVLATGLAAAYGAAIVLYWTSLHEQPEAEAETGPWSMPKPKYN